MLTLYYGPGACSMAAHIVLEESGEKYEPKRMDLGKGEQKTEAYLKIHPLGRVPALGLDDGSPLTENTAILPYLGKRFKLWPTDPLAEARALSTIGFFAATVHPAHAHISRPERYATDTSYFPNIQAQGKKSFHEYLKQIDGMLAGREWLSDSYSVLDPYAFTFYTWGIRREVPMAEMKNYTAHKDRMLKRPAVQRVVEDEKVKV
jgi:glutathione S-transferase